MRKKVIIESRYRAGGGYTPSENVEFAERLCLEAVKKGLNPFASHLFFTRFLNDKKTGERTVGIKLGLEWGESADLVWIGLRHQEEASEGVSFAIAHWRKRDIPIHILRCHPDGEILSKGLLNDSD